MGEHMQRLSFNTILIFAIVLAILLNSPEVAHSQNSCIDCHVKPAPPQTTWPGSIHAKVNVTCDKCHGGYPTQSLEEQAHLGIKTSISPESPIYYKNVPETCGVCHKKQYEAFTKSLHYKNLKENKLAPYCVTCHGSHDVALADPLVLSKKCSICHNEEMKIKPAIPSEAREMMRLFEVAKSDIAKAQGLIDIAKERDKNTSKAEEILKEAKIKLAKSIDIWHAFNITSFKIELVDALDRADKSYELTSALVPEAIPKPAPTPRKPICGPTIISLIAMIPLLTYLLLVRRNLPIF